MTDEIPTGAPVAPWHALSQREVLARLESDPLRGLTLDEARRRLERFGPNRLAEERPVTFWEVAREEVTEPMIVLLLVVGMIYALSGEIHDAIAIFFVIAVVVFVEVFNEYRAKAAIASLRRLAEPTSPAVRGGRYQDLLTEELVPGDLVLLRPGERVPADLRLLEAIGLRIDESSLTGESVPVTKNVDAVELGAELGDRYDMAHAGTLVTSGKGRGVVVATGVATEIGRIAGMVREAREPRTPLQLAMRQLAGWLVWLALGFSLLVPVLGFLFGQPLRQMILTGLTLAFATIPEELPILIMIVLGLGALKLSRQNAIVKRLRAGETLGSVSTVATDKTGTITENRMAVVEMRVAGRAQAMSPQEAATVPDGQMLLELGALASDATIAITDGRDGFAGDPTDTAFLVAAKAVGIDLARLFGDGLVEEFTFDERRRLMSAIYRRNNRLVVVAKGSPEAILIRCSRQFDGGVERSLDEESRRAALALAEQMAGRGLRVLALGYKTLPQDILSGREGGADRLLSAEVAEANLTFAGMAGLLDPPRSEVPGALGELRTAGIRVLMLTGDHPATAKAIAAAVGIDGGRVLSGRDIEMLDDVGLQSAMKEASVYARISPAHKLRIVRALHGTGEVVAVTGDGVNDAPALKEADIGVAMGQTGTDVAREAADMVLADDNFATIAVAVREGRKLYDNLRKAVRYYLAAKLALISTSLLAVLAQLPVPFTPIQIVVIDLFMDLGVSVGLTTEPAEGDVMARPPRDPKHPFMDHAMQLGIFLSGLSLCAGVTIAYIWAFWRGSTSAQAQTLAFATWMVGHVVLAFHMRTERQPLALAGLFSNPAMVLWGITVVLVTTLSTNVPALGQAFKVVPLTAEDWLVALAVSIVATSWWEAWKLWRWGT
ncbi:MAG: cation-transporting P-type ATPase [Chloroflexi bacterium]|nr:cation-transporting P-type ATPase [Chloroflexota bacterium]